MGFRERYSRTSEATPGLVTPYFVAQSASRRIEDIYLFTLDRWGEMQADRYIDGLFDTFGGIADGTAPFRKINDLSGRDVRATRYAHHVVFWQPHPIHGVAILSVLHGRMDLPERLREDIDTDEP